MKLSSGQRIAAAVTAAFAVCAISFCGGYFTKTALSSGKSGSYTVTASEARPLSALPPEQAEERDGLFVDINHANADELSALNGIGEKLAERIIEYREANGPFNECYELMNVSGIGSGIYEKIKNNIYVAR